MKRKLITASLILIIGYFQACKKDSDDETTTPTPTPTENVVCDGKSGVSSYFPLAQNNQYVFKRNYSAPGHDIDSSTVSGTSTYNGVTYMKVREYRGIDYSTIYRYYRTDSTGDVYLYESGQEYLIMPASPTLNQMLGADPTHYGTTRKVTSLTASLTTSVCSYTNLLVIENYGVSGGLVSTVYYKKGLGFVQDGDFHIIKATVH